MNKLMWLAGASLTLYVISGQRVITEEMAYVAAACVIVILMVIVPFFWGTLFGSRQARIESRTVVGTHKTAKISGLGWLVGYDEATITQQFRIDGGKKAVEEAGGKEAESYGWIPMGGPLGSYAPKKDVGPTWSAIVFGAIGILALLALIFLIVLIVTSVI